ncbi:hypothetical protein B0H10DRAFT_1939340 [Mycena sp. CBHHK59/15]|nr:hypothetical protein B0H10DRAFT_1939340 [Mycena sp. CBHHK59/15]
MYLIRIENLEGWRDTNRACRTNDGGLSDRQAHDCQFGGRLDDGSKCVDRIDRRRGTGIRTDFQARVVIFHKVFIAGRAQILAQIGYTAVPAVVYVCEEGLKMAKRVPLVGTTIHYASEWASMGEGMRKRSDLLRTVAELVIETLDRCQVCRIEIGQVGDVALGIPRC